MESRKVERTQKDRDGDILGLCGSGNWSPRKKADAIYDIEFGICSYYVETYRGRTEVRVVNGLTGKYLRTIPDQSHPNNLDNLPDC